jgi:hypothetical protein
MQPFFPDLKDRQKGPYYTKGRTKTLAIIFHTENWGSHFAEDGDQKSFSVS